MSSRPTSSVKPSTGSSHGRARAGHQPRPPRPPPPPGTSASGLRPGLRQGPQQGCRRPAAPARRGPSGRVALAATRDAELPARRTTSATVPSATTRPRCRMRTWSPVCSTSASRWVLMITVVPRSRAMRDTRSSSCRWPLGSRTSVGSSRITSCGRLTRARATPRRCRIPRLYVETSDGARSASPPRRAGAARSPWPASAVARTAGRERSATPRRSGPGDSRRSREASRSCRRISPGCVQGIPPTLKKPASGRGSSQHPDHVVLPAPLGPRKPRTVPAGP